MRKMSARTRSCSGGAGPAVLRSVALLLALTGAAGHVQAAELLHQYDFDGTLTDTLGTGVALEEFANIATSAYGADGWSWTADTNPGGGLKLETGLLDDPQSYSLGFRVKYGSVTGYRKIVSFKGMGDDNGLYFLNGTLVFYPFGASASVTFAIDTFYDFIFSRSSDDVIRVYIVDDEGSVTKVYEEADPTDASVPVTESGKYQFIFFCDDTATSHEWTPSGTVQRLRVWNGPLNESAVGEALSTSPPADDAAPELQVAIVAADQVVNVGEEIGFTVTVSNVGDGDATNVVLRFPVPPITEFVGAWLVGPEAGQAAPLNAAVDGDDVVIELGDLPAAESLELELVFRATASGTVTLSASASCDEEPTAVEAQADSSVGVEDVYWEIVETVVPFYACGMIGLVSPLLLTFGLLALRRRHHRN